MEFNPNSVKFITPLADTALITNWAHSQPSPIGIVVTGRSNVGKSSLINSILKRDIARTSKTPGRTREINVFEFSLFTPGNPDPKNTPAQKFCLIDLPGYGYAEVSRAESNRWNEMLGYFFEVLPPNMLILNIQDCRHPLQDTDRQFLEFFKTLHNEAFLLFNKYDKLKTQKERAAMKAQLPALLKEMKVFKQVYLVSAEKKTGLNEASAGMINYLLKKIMVPENSPENT